MKHHLLALALLLSSFTYSQITFNSSHHASGSYSLPMTTVATGLLTHNFDTTGTNMTWDYSALAMNLSGRKYTITPASSGYQATFVTQCILAGGGLTCLTKWNTLTNMGMIDLDSLDAVVATLYDVMTMVKKSNNYLIGNIKGLKIKDTNGLTVPIVAEYTNKDTILNFPLTYQDSGKSYGAWGVDLNSIGQNIVFERTYDRSYKVEGWGKLMTPYQTHNSTLKIKTILDQVDSINMFGTKFGLPTKNVEYTWYDLNYKLPVMIATGIEVLGSVSITNVQYYDTRVVGIEENKKSEFSIYPNPTSDFLNINISSELNPKAYQIIDIQGKTINKETFNSVISTRNLKPGVYFIQLISEDNSIINTKKFVVE